MAIIQAKQDFILFRKVITFITFILMLFILVACKSEVTNIPDGVIEYSIAFDLNGGQGVLPGVQNVRFGQKAVEPQVEPSRSGYRFLGWFKGLNSDQPFDFANELITSTIILYAKWGLIDIVIDEGYDESLSEWSEPGFLYIHYYRYLNEETDYNKWSIWLWPKNGVGRFFDWELFDQSGAVAKIDLTQVYTDGGPNGDQTVDFRNAEDIGFLIVYRPSITGPGMWQSDGSADTIIPNIYSHIRESGAIHLFLLQNAISEYKFSYSTGNEELRDPYEGLLPGEKVSIINLNSSVNYFDKAQTSLDFLGVGVGYQIMVSSFADSNGDGFGDIKGITNNLDYLKNDLNAGVLWLTPIQLSDSYHGYDIIDYYKIDPKFGTDEDFRELLFEANKRGIKVIMDLVINHTSANNSWFKKSANLDPEYRNYYRWNYGAQMATQPDWYQYSNTGYYYYGKFASSMPELNFDYQGTRDAVMDIAYYWMSYGLDGFRLDAVKHFYNEGEYDISSRGENDIIHYEVGYSRNVTKNVNFLREFNARLKSVYPNAFVIGENFDGNPANLAPYFSGMDAQFNFNLYFELIQTALNREDSANGLARAYGFNYQGASLFRGDQVIESTMTSNHDITRLINHSVGNQIITQANKEIAITRSKLYAATIMTMPGITWIYYGDELGMSGKKTNNVYYDQNGNISFTNDWHADRWFRQPFKFSTQQTIQTTSYRFEIYDVEWDLYNISLPGALEQRFDASSMLRHYMALTNLKSNDPVLLRGNYEALTTTNQNLFAFKRTFEGTTYMVYHNYSGASVSNFNLGGQQVIWSTPGATIHQIPAYGSIIIKG
jgi:alpha-amylase